MSNNVEKVKRIQRGVSTLSSLQVDSISSMGGGHVDGAGLVVQYVETSDDNSAAITVTSTSWATTGITVSITPKFVGSKVCVDYTGSMAYAQANTTMHITLFKDNVRAMGIYGLGHLEGKIYSPSGGQYTFTTTSLNTIELAVYARRANGTGTVYPVHQETSYVLSATEYAQ